MKIHRLLLALPLLLLGGCVSSGLEWEVTRFHELESIRGKTFVVIPMVPTLAASAEFKDYARLTSQRLVSHGMIELPADRSGSSDYIVGLDYGVGPPLESSYRRQIYTPAIRSSVTIPNPATGAPVTVLHDVQAAPSAVETVTVVNYRRYVRIFIHAGHPDAEGKFDRKYEATAESDSPTNELNGSVPSGIAALLAEFPGVSGKSATVQVPR